MTIEKKYRPRCFFDLEVGGQPVGRVVFELFADASPITCENFRALCTGEKGLGKTTNKALHYKDSIFHRVVRNFMVQGGDFSAGNGSGGESIYGGTFKDENFTMKHDSSFLLSMANRGKDTNGSQFFIITQPTPHLDGVHVVFGRVISGQEIISEIENQKTDHNSRPFVDAKVANCGELVLKLKPKDKKKRNDKSSSEEGEMSDEKSKKRRKHKKHSKKTKKEKKPKKEIEPEVEPKKVEEDPEQDCSVRAEEIPDIPSNNFLMRRTTANPDESRRGSFRTEGYQRRSKISRSGRKIKGRGFMRYRTPSPTGSRSGSETPPHWKQAQSRVRPLKEVLEEQKSQPPVEEKDEKDVSRSPSPERRGRPGAMREPFPEDRNYGRPNEEEMEGAEFDPREGDFRNRRFNRSDSFEGEFRGGVRNPRFERGRMREQDARESLGGRRGFRHQHPQQQPLRTRNNDHRNGDYRSDEDAGSASPPADRLQSSIIIRVINQKTTATNDDAELKPTEMDPNVEPENNDNNEKDPRKDARSSRRHERRHRSRSDGRSRRSSRRHHSEHRSEENEEPPQRKIRRFREDPEDDEDNNNRRHEDNNNRRHESNDNNRRHDDNNARRHEDDRRSYSERHRSKPLDARKNKFEDIHQNTEGHEELGQSPLAMLELDKIEMDFTPSYHNPAAILTSAIREKEPGEHTDDSSTEPPVPGLENEPSSMASMRNPSPQPSKYDSKDVRSRFEASKIASKSVKDVPKYESPIISKHETGHSYKSSVLGEPPIPGLSLLEPQESSVSTYLATTVPKMPLTKNDHPVVIPGLEPVYPPPPVLLGTLKQSNFEPPIPGIDPPIPGLDPPIPGLEPPIPGLDLIPKKLPLIAKGITRFGVRAPARIPEEVIPPLPPTEKEPEKKKHGFIPIGLSLPSFKIMSTTTSSSSGSSGGFQAKASAQFESTPAKTAQFDPSLSSVKAIPQSFESPPPPKSNRFESSPPKAVSNKFDSSPKIPGLGGDEDDEEEDEPPPPGTTGFDLPDVSSIQLPPPPPEEQPLTDKFLDSALAKNEDAKDPPAFLTTNTSVTTVAPVAPEQESHTKIKLNLPPKTDPSPTRSDRSGSRSRSRHNPRRGSSKSRSRSRSRSNPRRRLPTPDRYRRRPSPFRGGGGRRNDFRGPRGNWERWRPQRRRSPNMDRRRSFSRGRRASRSRSRSRSRNQVRRSPFRRDNRNRRRSPSRSRSPSRGRRPVRRRSTSSSSKSSRSRSRSRKRAAKGKSKSRSSSSSSSS